jgi:hypothetical protein
MHFNLAALKDGIAFANDSHVTFVEVTERLSPILTLHMAANYLPDIPTLLHRYLCDAGQWLAVLVKRSGVADHKDFRMGWDTKVSLNTNSTGAIGFHA